ncbi:MAG: DUF3160 domain-containing protein [Clostridia bacterium]|nr:DUF3160 domain-containing protein [Clostridia bacterium]
MKKLSCLILILIIILSACGRSTSAPPPDATQNPTAANQTGIVDAPTPDIVREYQRLNINPKVAPYKVEPGLANVENRDKFELTEAQIAKILQNGFVVTPADNYEMADVLDGNVYSGTSNFITTDIVLHSYHVLFNYALKQCEQNTFLEKAHDINKQLLQASKTLLEKLSEKEGFESAADYHAALYMAAYFGVAEMCFTSGEQSLQPADDLAADIAKEYASIMAAKGIGDSDLLGTALDYSLFKPRGHYEDSEPLQRYFRAMSWYGNAPLILIDQEGNPNEENVLRAMLVGWLMQNAKVEPAWGELYGATCFFVGEADDITPTQILDCVASVVGNTGDPTKYSAQVAEMAREIKSLPKAKIQSQSAEGRVEFRFMGSRYTADSDVLQTLTHWPQRPMPNGLDVPAAFGSARAEALVKQLENPAAKWPEYDEKLGELQKRMAKVPDKTWKSNLYYSWLFTMQAINEKPEPGYPSFMLNDAWLDKSLATSLGSWAELRHDTILYVKQSVAEGDGDFERPYSYVEPNAEAYNRLIWLCQQTKAGLGDLLAPEAGEKLDDLEEILQFLRDCSIKELKAEELTEEEHNRLFYIGSAFEDLLLRTRETEDGWYETERLADRDMALIADVHSSNGQYLQAAVGRAGEIYAVFPAAGKLWLGRGPVFDYYEFVSGERLTNSQWRETFQDQARPEWVGSFMAP